MEPSSESNVIKVKSGTDSTGMQDVFHYNDHYSHLDKWPVELELEFPSWPPTPMPLFLGRRKFTLANAQRRGKSTRDSEELNLAKHRDYLTAMGLHVKLVAELQNEVRNRFRLLKQLTSLRQTPENLLLDNKSNQIMLPSTEQTTLCLESVSDLPTESSASSSSSSSLDRIQTNTKNESILRNPTPIEKSSMPSNVAVRKQTQIDQDSSLTHSCLDNLKNFDLNHLDMTTKQSSVRGPISSTISDSTPLQLSSIEQEKLVSDGSQSIGTEHYDTCSGSDSIMSAVSELSSPIEEYKEADLNTDEQLISSKKRPRCLSRDCSVEILGHQNDHSIAQKKEYTLPILHYTSKDVWDSSVPRLDDDSWATLNSSSVISDPYEPYINKDGQNMSKTTSVHLLETNKLKSEHNYKSYSEKMTPINQDPYIHNSSYKPTHLQNQQKLTQIGKTNYKNTEWLSCHDTLQQTHTSQPNKKYNWEVSDTHDTDIPINISYTDKRNRLDNWEKYRHETQAMWKPDYSLPHLSGGPRLSSIPTETPALWTELAPTSHHILQHQNSFPNNIASSLPFSNISRPPALHGFLPISGPLKQPSLL